MKPVILLTCSGLRSESPDLPMPEAIPGGWGPFCNCRADQEAVKRGCLKAAYIRGVERAGGAPLLVPNTDDATAVQAAVRACGGLLLTGGWDIDPALYSQPRHATVTMTDPRRDATELAAIREAVARHKPIFGICRGVQMINVALGGTLIQDIPSHQQLAGTQSDINHRRQDHAIRVEAGTKLRELWGPSPQVNSRHHQAIDKLGKGLKVTAWSPDGVIEGVESSEDFPLLAVQSHPEDLIDLEAKFLAPFAWLVKAALNGKP